MTSVARRRQAVAWGVALAVFALAAIAFARPGGGNTYGGSSRGSGSSGFSGGGGGSGGGDLIFSLLIELVFAYPQVGIPLLIIVAVGYALMRSRDRAGPAWNSAAAQRMTAAGRELDDARFRSNRQGRMLAAFERIREIDPEFSLVVFEDFFYSLYAEAHRARGAGALERLAPFIGATARRSLEALGGKNVRAVVVGAMRYTEIRGLDTGAQKLGVTIELEANYTQDEAGATRTYYVVERWSASRSRKARSRPPKRARTFDCPNCGAPLEKIVGITCSYCHEVVGTGDFDWLVEDIAVVERQVRPPALTTEVEERGTELPTVADPDARSRFDALVQRDPEMSFEALAKRVELVFTTLQTAWGEQQLPKARAYLSDRLYETFEYWIEAYRAAGLRNVTEQARIVDLVVARVVSDRHYDAITLRVFATSLDYTLDQAGKVVTGSRSRQRRYSEYWTLIRGATVRGAPKSEAACPSCGAPLDIGMAGTCNHCRAEVTSGDFDWVLSRIEQDESY
jgi:predicted lipid-binding transport protein (Tim44 family)/predicted RNA-binding Zn-ribbon protein involved in translation (DUF1610 family)